MIGLLVDLPNFLKSCITCVLVCGIFCTVVSQEHKNFLPVGQQQMVLAQQGCIDDFLKNYALLQDFYSDQKGRTFVHRAIRYNKKEFLQVCGQQPWWDFFLTWFVRLPKKKSVFAYASRYNPKIIRLLLELGFIISDEDKKQMLNTENFLGLCALFAYGVPLPKCEDSVDAEIIDGWKCYQESKDMSALFKVEDFEIIPFEHEDLHKNDGWLAVHSYLWLFAACGLQDMRACIRIYNTMLDGEKEFLYQQCVARPLLKHMCLKSPTLLVWAFQQLWSAWKLQDFLSLVSSERDRHSVIKYMYRSTCFKKIHAMLVHKNFADLIIICA